MPKTKPYHSAKIFWDVKPEQLDYVMHKSFIVTRVFEKGDVEDIKACRRYYTRFDIEEILLNTPFLSKMRLALCSAVIDQPQEAFRCYTTRQLNPEHLPY